MDSTDSQKLTFINFKPVLDYLRSTKVLYFVVAMEAVVLLLTAFGFLPRIATLYEIIILIVYLALLKPMQALRLFILSIPWIVAVPLGGYDQFQTWRILILEVFILALAYNWNSFVGAAKKGAKSLFKFFKLSKIDLAFWFFIAASLILLLFNGGFLIPGAKYVITLLNLYGIFVTARFIIDSREDRGVVLRTVAISGLVIIIAGFIQLIMFLRMEPAYFWQYWVNTFIPVIYGNEYAQVSAESNTWFSYYPNQPTGLRMFSLMPGTQVFALVGILLFPHLVALKEKASAKGDISNYKWWYAAVVITALGIVLTSVRASLVGSLLPLAVLAFLYFKNKVDKEWFKKGTFAILIFLALFVLSPVIQRGLNLIAINDTTGSLFSRSKTLFEKDYESNRARLIIWEESIKSIARHPFAGVGMSNFALVFEEGQNAKNYGDLVSKKESFVNVARKHISAHNIYLQVLVESGLAGLAFFFYFLCVVLNKTYLIFKGKILDNIGEEQKLYALLFGVSFLWILGHSMFDSVFLMDDEPWTYFWLGLALLDPQSS